MAVIHCMSLNLRLPCSQRAVTKPPPHEGGFKRQRCLFVRLSVSLSPIAHNRLERKPANQSTWNVSTVRTPWKSITGCSNVIVNPRWRTGGWPLIRKIVVSAYRSERMPDYDEIWYTKSDTQIAIVINELTKIQSVNSRWWPSAILENIGFGCNLEVDRPIFTNFSTMTQHPTTIAVESYKIQQVGQKRHGCGCYNLLLGEKAYRLGHRCDTLVSK